MRVIGNKSAILQGTNAHKAVPVALKRFSRRRVESRGPNLIRRAGKVHRRWMNEGRTMTCNEFREAYSRLVGNT